MGREICILGALGQLVQFNILGTIGGTINTDLVGGSGTGRERGEAIGVSKSALALLEEGVDKVEVFGFKSPKSAPS